MPLNTSTAPPSSTNDVHFLIFFSSGTPPWCPDCVDALPVVEKVFDQDSATNSNQAYLILVGERAQWKFPDNQYRKQYNLKCLPTVIRMENGKETGRLGGLDSTDATKLAAFVSN